jgi:hypothetical protein
VFYALPSTDFNVITTGPANREGYSPGPGYSEITGLGTPKANLIVQALLNPPFFLFPPFLTSLAVSAGNVTAPNSTLQAGQDALVLESSSSPTHFGELGQSAGSGGLSVFPVAAISVAPAMGELTGPLEVSGAPATPAGTGPDGWTSWSPIPMDLASVSDRSSLPLLGPVAGPAMGDASAAPVSLRFVDQHDGFALPGANVVEVVDQVPANTAVLDYFGPQTGWLEAAVPSAGTALLTQATDACFESDSWIVDGANSLVRTPSSAGRANGVSQAFAVTAGVLAVWAVRRTPRSTKRSSPDATKS